MTNAFVGRTERPSDKELASALGAAFKLWEQLIQELSLSQEWNSYSPKAGWSLKLKKKDRTILYLSPCACCFRASFALGDKALKSALASKFPKSTLKLIAEARKYAEGTAVRIEVHKPADLLAVEKLAQIKLDH